MVPVILYPARVQGEGAGGEIVRALRTANARREVDVVIVCRGGGSLEDLWAFNEEAVARAIFASALPVVSGVGHETDFSIADFVADARAPTPTAAAAAAGPDRAALREEVDAYRRRLARDLRRIVESHAQRLDHLARRLLTPAERLARDRDRVAQLGRRMRIAALGAAQMRRMRVASLAPRLARALPDPATERRELLRLAQRMSFALHRGAERRERRLEALRNSLGHLDPTQVLARGYSIVRDTDGHVRRSSTGLVSGQPLDITFSEGGAEVAVRQPRLPPK
jgi:exodeoxyribonuclease VII large subunit